MKIKLGQKVKDKITGYEGIVVVKTDWIHGCTRFGVKSQSLKDGKPIDMEWFDEPDLEVVKDVKKTKVKPRHGPRSDPTRSRPGERR